MLRIAQSGRWCNKPPKLRNSTEMHNLDPQPMMCGNQVETGRGFPRDNIGVENEKKYPKLTYQLEVLCLRERHSDQRRDLQALTSVLLVVA